MAPSSTRQVYTLKQEARIGKAPSGQDWCVAWREIKRGGDGLCGARGLPSWEGRSNLRTLQGTQLVQRKDVLMDWGP